MTTHKALQAWINEIAELTQPESSYWCNGSESEFRELTRLLLSNGGFVELNQETHPGCYLHRSDPSDVARVEHLTFVPHPPPDQVAARTARGNRTLGDVHQSALGKRRTRGRRRVPQ